MVTLIPVSEPHHAASSCVRLPYLELLVRLPDGLAIALLAPLMAVLPEEPHCLAVEQEQRPSCRSAHDGEAFAACKSINVVRQGSPLSSASLRLSEYKRDMKHAWGLLGWFFADTELVGLVIGQEVNNLLVAQPGRASLCEDVTQRLRQLFHIASRGQLLGSCSHDVRPN